MFNDLDPKTVEFLQTGIQKNLPHPNVDWHVTANEFSGYSQRIVDRLDRGWESPLFAFIDPFGIKDMPFKQVERLLATPSSECFINLMAGWANRFIGHPDVEVAKHVTNLLGGEHVEEVLASTDRIATIRSLYETKLKTRVPYVKTFQMRDEGNVRDNALIFCSQKPLGFRKMKEAMWTIDPIYGNSFSAHDQARGKAGQDLFDSVQPPQTQLLGRQIAEKLRKDGPVGYDDLALWVEQNTDFLRKHARSELLAARERGELIIRAENGSLFKGNQLPKQAQISLRNQNG